jgi:hypothetical protein
VDGSAVGGAEVLVDPFSVSRYELVGVHAEVGACVYQELLIANSVPDEEAACGSGADMCHW